MSQHEQINALEALNAAFVPTKIVPKPWYPGAPTHDDDGTPFVYLGPDGTVITIVTDTSGVRGMDGAEPFEP